MGDFLSFVSATGSVILLLFAGDLAVRTFRRIDIGDDRGARKYGALAVACTAVAVGLAASIISEYWRLS